MSFDIIVLVWLKCLFHNRTCQTVIWWQKGCLYMFCYHDYSRIWILLFIAVLCCHTVIVVVCLIQCWYRASTLLWQQFALHLHNRRIGEDCTAIYKGFQTLFWFNYYTKKAYTTHDAIFVSSIGKLFLFGPKLFWKVFPGVSWVCNVHI